MLRDVTKEAKVVHKTTKYMPFECPYETYAKLEYIMEGIAKMSCLGVQKEAKVMRK